MPNLVPKKKLWDIPECRESFTLGSAEVITQAKPSTEMMQLLLY